MKSEAIKIAAAIRNMRKTPMLDNAPKGLPKPPENADGGNVFGEFEQEGLSDPGIQNRVTGNGGGPVIGSNRQRTTRGN